MIKEGDEIYFEENGQIYSAKVINLTDTTFELDEFGSCDGNLRIDRSMIGYGYYTNREELERRIEFSKKK